MFVAFGLHVAFVPHSSVGFQVSVPFVPYGPHVSQLLLLHLVWFVVVQGVVFVVPVVLVHIAL